MPSLKRLLCSRINWQALIEVIVDYYYSYTKEIYATFRQRAYSSNDISAILIKGYKLSYAVLYPYFQYPLITNFPLSLIIDQTII